MTARVTLLVNPAANAGRAARLAEPVAARLARAGTVRTVRADSREGSARLARSVVAEADALVVLGGDGIVHQVLPAVGRDRRAARHRARRYRQRQHGQHRIA